MPKSGELAYLRNLGEDGVLHAVNKPFSDPLCGDYLIAIGTVIKLLPQPPARLLDLGCGTGWTSCLFAKVGYEVVGQDIAPDMIQWANHNKARERLVNVHFVVSDYETLGFEEQFDAAVFFDSLHHAEDEHLALGSVYRALRQGGVCVTREPGEGHSRAELSRRAAEQYQVTEKDMPPCRIAELAFEIGFRECAVFPFPDAVVSALVRLDAHRRRSSRQGMAGWLRHLRGCLRGAKRVYRMQRRMLRAGGVVQLVK